MQTGFTVFEVPKLIKGTMKDLSRDGHLAGMMAAMKDALINLAFHLAVM